MMLKFADLIEKHRHELAYWESIDNGVTLRRPSIFVPLHSATAYCLISPPYLR